MIMSESIEDFLANVLLALLNGFWITQISKSGLTKKDFPASGVLEKVSNL